MRVLESPNWNASFHFTVRNVVYLVSATSAVEVCVRVLQQLLAVDVQTVYVVPGVAHVALDPLHRVLLGQPTPWRRARLHRPGSHFLLVLIVVVFIVGGGRGGAGGGGGRGGGRGR